MTEAIDEAVQRLKKGDPEAMRTVIALTERTLYRVAARLTGSLADADDLLQEVYVKGYEGVVYGDLANHVSFDRWLYRATVNASLDLLRSKKRRRAGDVDDLRHADEPIDARGTSPDAALAVAELGTILETLSLEQRTIWVLKELEGHTSREIAELLELSEGAVEQRLLRARAAIKEKMS